MSQETVITKDRISYSELTLFLRCPYLWYFKKVEGYREFPRYHFTFGKAIHESLAYYYTNKKESAKEEVVDQAVEVGHDFILLNAPIEMEECAVSEEHFQKYQEDMNGNTEDVMKRLLTEYVEKTDYDPAEVEVEHEFPLYVENEQSINLVVRLDLVTTDNVLVEHKTSRVKPSETKTPINQFLTYCAAYQDKYGLMPRRCDRNTLVKYKTERQSPFYQNTFTPEDIEKNIAGYMNTLKGAMRLMNQHFWKPSESDLQWCSHCDEKHDYKLT